MSLVVDIRKKLALFDLEVSVEVGDETLGFLGASGCGKSMTLRCVAGVETPDEGKIILNGRTVFDSAAKVNLTPQQRRDLDEILARKIHSLSICRAMMHLDDDLGAPLRNPYDGKPDPILDVSPDLRPAITKIIAPATNAAPAHPATK